MALRPEAFAFTLLLGALAALPPLAIDMGLPALEKIQHGLATTPYGAGLTLSVFLAAFAAGQLVLGPLSDRIGRRPVLLGGLAVFTLGGLGCTAAPTIVTLIAARCVEGCGAAAGTVMAFATVRDLFAGVVARKRLSAIATVLPLAPMVAPTLGSAVLAVANWRGIYAVLSGAGLLLFAAVALLMRETHRPSAAPPAVWHAYWRVLKHPQAGGFAAANALSFAMLFAWVSGSPFVLMGAAGVTATTFGLLFACTSGGLLVGAWINGRMVHRVRPSLPIVLGLVGTLAGSALVLGQLSGARVAPATLVPAVMLTMVFRGAASPNIAHGALEPLPAIAGVVSAVLGASQMAAGAAVSAIVAALLPSLGVASVGVAMVGCAAVALLVGSFASLRYRA
jgi:DHA1 family bicyclomycin/chloramphenicol resistance-like MFS transporter